MSYPHSTILPPIFLGERPVSFRSAARSLIHDEASTPNVLQAKAEAGVVPGWMVAVGFHYPSGMIIIRSYL